MTSVQNQEQVNRMSSSNMNTTNTFRPPPFSLYSGNSKSPESKSILSSDRNCQHGGCGNDAGLGKFCQTHKSLHVPLEARKITRPVVVQPLQVKQQKVQLQNMQQNISPNVQKSISKTVRQTVSTPPKNTHGISVNATTNISEKNEPTKLLCNYATGKCKRPRSLKMNGQYHGLCEMHRRNANRNQKKYDRKCDRKQKRAAKNTIFTAEQLRKESVAPAFYQNLSAFQQIQAMQQQQYSSQTRQVRQLTGSETLLSNNALQQQLPKLFSVSTPPDVVRSTNSLQKPVQPTERMEALLLACSERKEV